MKILVVEDEHKIANTVKKGLEQELYIVDVAYDGITGYDLASTGVYDVILLDLMLPGMDGTTICKKLREQQIHTAILILTAKGQIDDKVSGLDSGADDYLTKPFSFEELLARIRSLVRRPREMVDSLITAADLELDPKLFTVSRSRKSIQLSNKEFALLEYFMRNQNRILTKDQLIDHVWDYNSDVLPNTVEVYIKNLRTKIDQPFPKSAPLIHTVRGFGYKFGEEA